jgi:hypothetical protein
MRNFTRLSVLAICLFFGLQFANAQVPAVDAPTPDYPAADVLSFFSDEYGSYTTFNNLAWGQTCSYRFVEVGTGSSAMLLEDLVWLPIGLQSPGDIKSYQYLHIDVFCNEETSFRVGFNTYYPANIELYFEPSITVPAGKWYSIDYPIEDFRNNGFGISAANVIRFGNEEGIIYSNEIYVANMFVFNGEPKYIGGGLNITEASESEFKVYPSVVSEDLTIESASIINKVTITNMAGQAIASYVVDAPSDVLNLNKLNAGVYLVSASLGSGETVTKRIIKK